MATSFHCDIASAEDSIFSGEVESLVAAGSLGDLGIYPAVFWKFSQGKLIF
jgi:F-type H+-transporting ATPase subunit epsilon